MVNQNNAEVMNPKEFICIVYHLLTIREFFHNVADADFCTLWLRVLTTSS